MRRCQEIIPALTGVISFVVVGMTLIGPMVVHGQSKGKMHLTEDRGLQHTWGRSPFLLPSGVRSSAKGGAARVSKKVASKPQANSARVPPVPRKVRAILISDHIRLASIDQHIVTVGDVIDGEKVLEIKTDRVILGKGGKKRTVLLYRNPILLTVEEK